MLYPAISKTLPKALATGKSKPQTLGDATLAIYPISTVIAVGPTTVTSFQERPPPVELIVTVDPAALVVAEPAPANVMILAAAVAVPESAAKVRGKVEAPVIVTVSPAPEVVIPFVPRTF